MKGASPIITLAEASRRLDEEIPFIKGITLGLGERLHEVGTSLCMTEKAFAKVESFLAKIDVPRGKGGPKRQAATA